jgi:hypothetical protein
MIKNSFKTLFAGMVILFSLTQAQAMVGPHKITVDDFPYVASLGESAEHVESALVAQATTVCGTLENVARLDDVSLNLQKTSVPNSGVNPNGIPGAQGDQAVFTFLYPRVTGSATVFCKN